MTDAADNALVEQIRKAQLEREGVLLGPGAKGYDKDLYEDAGDYDASIGINDVDDEELDPDREKGRASLPSYTAPKNVFDKEIAGGDDEDPFKATRRKTIMEREDDYHKKGRMSRAFFSPDRADMFGDKTPANDLRKPSDALLEAKLEREEAELKRKIARKKDQERKDKEKRDVQDKKKKEKVEEDKKKDRKEERREKKEKVEKGEKREKEKLEKLEKLEKREKEKGEKRERRRSDKERDKDRDKDRDRERDREDREDRKRSHDSRSLKPSVRVNPHGKHVIRV